LIAYEDKVTSELNSLEDDSYSYDNLQNAFEEFEKNVLKNRVLKKKVISLSNELNDLINKNENLDKQINSLNDKNMFLEKEIIQLEIKSQDSLQKRKVNDVETSSLNTQDSNIFYHI
jgi:hypothetical protein